MAFALQSIATPTLYWTGTVLETRGSSMADWGIFDTIDKAREFDSRSEASEHKEKIQVPTTIVEV